MIEEAGKGILLYVLLARADQPARAAAVGAPVGRRPAQARLRDFGLGAQVLAHLGARRSAC